MLFPAEISVLGIRPGIPVTVEMDCWNSSPDDREHLPKLSVKELRGKLLDLTLGDVLKISEAFARREVCSLTFDHSGNGIPEDARNRYFVLKGFDKIDESVLEFTARRSDW